MLNVLICLAGVFIILVTNELLARAGVLRQELRRKFTHILTGCFVAVWPWLVSWQTIQWLGLAMVLVVALNRRLTLFKFNGQIQRISYGDYLFATSITLCSILTTNKFFFAIAILHMAIADGLAAIIGKRYGARWHYSVFGQNKTLVGTMTFWLASICIFGAGIILTSNAVPFSGYVLCLVLAPPFLTILENISGGGTDNLTVPVAALVALHLAAAL